MWRNGRRARFRSVCPKGRGGSTPPIPTSAVGGVCQQKALTAPPSSFFRGAEPREPTVRWSPEVQRSRSAWGLPRAGARATTSWSPIRRGHRFYRGLAPAQPRPGHPTGTVTVSPRAGARATTARSPNRHGHRFYRGLAPAQPRPGHPTGTVTALTPGRRPGDHVRSSAGPRSRLYRGLARGNHAAVTQPARSRFSLWPLDCPTPPFSGILVTCARETAAVVKIMCSSVATPPRQADLDELRPPDNPNSPRSPGCCHATHGWLWKQRAEGCALALRTAMAVRLRR
jgi:hypothetical protein